MNQEGKIQMIDPGIEYQYFLKDHLGNTRVIFIQNGDIKQKADYYPFGMTSYLYDDNIDNKYLYNGKELQDDLGLDWYDYGARMYDPALGRFHTIDPLAEWDLKTSPYVYVGNNPILYIDPDGMRRTKEERLKAREERRQKREKRWAEKRGTKYIKPVNCYAKDGSKKSTSRKNNNIGFFNPVHGINWTTSVDLFGRSGPARQGNGSAESENIDAWLLNANLSVANLHMPFGNAMQRMLTIALGAFNIGQKIGAEIEKITSDKEIIENNIGDDSPKPDELIKTKPVASRKFNSDSLVPYINTSNDTTEYFNVIDNKWHRKIAPGDTSGYIRNWKLN